MALLIAGMLALWGCSDCKRVPDYWCDPIQITDKVTVTTPDGQWTTTGVDFDSSALAAVFYSSDIEIGIEGYYPDSRVWQPGHYSFSVAMKFDQLETGDVINLTDSTRIKDPGADGVFGEHYELKSGKIDAGTLTIVEFSTEKIDIKLEGLKISGIPWSNGKEIGHRVLWSIGPIEYMCKPRAKVVCRDPY